MADTLAAILGLGQQEAQRTNPFLDPNTLSAGLQAGVKSSREQQQLDLHKAAFGLQQQAQAFDQNYKTQVLDMKRKEFQSEQELNNMLFPVQGQMLKYQQAKAMSAIDLQSAQIDREEALTEQSYENQDKISASRQHADNFLTTKLGSYSDEELVSGKALADATSIPGITHEDLLRVTQAVKGAEAQQHIHNQKIEAANLELLQGQLNIDKNRKALTKYANTFDSLDKDQQKDIIDEITQEKTLESSANKRVFEQAGQPGMRTSIKTDAKGGKQITVAPSKYSAGGPDKFLGMTDNQYAKTISDIKKDQAFLAEFGSLSLKQQEVKARDVLKQRLGLQDEAAAPEASAAPVDNFFNSVGIE